MADIFDFWKFSSDIRQKRLVEMRIDIRSCAEIIGISAPTLSRLENGKTPDVYTYYAVCKWLAVPMERYFILPQ